MRKRKLTAEDFEGFPGFDRRTRDALLERQPQTVLEALKIPGVGRKTTGRLIDQGLLIDPEGVQEGTHPSLWTDR